MITTNILLGSLDNMLSQKNYKIFFKLTFNLIYFEKKKVVNYWQVETCSFFF